jgi:hypothetical protein
METILLNDAFFKKAEFDESVAMPLDWNIKGVEIPGFSIQSDRD